MKHARTNRSAQRNQQQRQMRPRFIHYKVVPDIVIMKRNILKEFAHLQQAAAYSHCVNHKSHRATFYSATIEHNSLLTEQASRMIPIPWTHHFKKSPQSYSQLSLMKIHYSFMYRHYPKLKWTITLCPTKATFTRKIISSLNYLSQLLNQPNRCSKSVTFYMYFTLLLCGCVSQRKLVSFTCAMLLHDFLTKRARQINDRLSFIFIL